MTNEHYYSISYKMLISFITHHATDMTGGSSPSCLPPSSPSASMPRSKPLPEREEEPAAWKSKKLEQIKRVAWLIVYFLSIFAMFVKPIHPPR